MVNVILLLLLFYLLIDRKQKPKKNYHSYSGFVLDIDTTIHNKKYKLSHDRYNKITKKKIVAKIIKSMILISD